MSAQTLWDILGGPGLRFTDRPRTRTRPPAQKGLFASAIRPTSDHPQPVSPTQPASPPLPTVPCPNGHIRQYIL